MSKAAKVLGNFITAVEVRTNLSPPIAVDVAKAGGAPSGVARLLVGLLQPTVVVQGPVASGTVAPAGEAWRYGGVALAALAVLVVGGAVAAGWALARR